MKTLSLLLCSLLVFLGGCSAIPTGKRTTTTSDVDQNGKVVRQTVVEEEAASQFPLSPEMARMQQACYESFSADTAVPDNVAAQMDARATENYLMVRELRLLAQGLSEYDPRQVCASPATIYDYAIQHDRQLFATIRSGIRDVKDAAVATTPWLMVAQVARDGLERAGGNTSVEAGGDATLQDVLNDKRATANGNGSQVQQEIATEKPVEVQGEGATGTGADGMDTSGGTGTSTTDNRDDSALDLL